jgi:hypothetical protein
MQQHKLRHESSPNLSESRLTISTQTIPFLSMTDDSSNSQLNDFESESISELDEEPEGISGNLCTGPPAVQSAPDSLDTLEAHFVPECLNPMADARIHDPHLSKYFFRQRVTSQSRHPNIHYQ